MFRVGTRLPISVVSPQPWFPLDRMIRLFRPYYRPPAPRKETVDEVEIFRPRYLSVPGLLKQFDALMMALGAFSTVRRLAAQGRATIIDAHFTFPDGCAACHVGEWLSKPVTITLRGTEARHVQSEGLRRRMTRAWKCAGRVFAVSESLRQLAIQQGTDPTKVMVVGNGVDLSRFAPMPKHEARAQLGIEPDARVIVTVGGLVERKGFNRVIECLPALREQFPAVQYVIVGGAGPEGDYEKTLRDLVASLGLQNHVKFLGPMPPQDVSRALSAADIFALASRNEGWANVLLEAMACGLPVVATDVGGNAEVVCRKELGIIVPFGDQAELSRALCEGLRRAWDRDAIRAYAAANTWEPRIDLLEREFNRLERRTTSFSSLQGHGT